MKLVRNSIGFGLIALAMTAPAWSQTVDVTAQVEINGQSNHASAKSAAAGDVVIWLTPTKRNVAAVAVKSSQGYTLVQKNKMFTPHLLVVPTGSSIDFPNLDPFFHNVFSLFNGKRFDLGLYEAHSHRAVEFDRDGISYIFCNIHPEMGAVVITLSTPYYGVSKADGAVVIHNVPAGNYQLNVWAENASNDTLNALGRSIDIGPQNTQLGVLYVKTTRDLMKQHKNKFGEEYPPTAKDPY